MANLPPPPDRPKKPNVGKVNTQIEFEINQILDSLDHSERIAQDEVLEMTDDKNTINAIDNERIGEE
jgi:hypothetical protein